MSLITQLQNKQVLLLGLGISGLSCVRYLVKQGISFAVNDSRENPVDSSWFHKAYPNITLVTGKWDTQLIGNADIIIASPGVDLQQAEFVEHIKDNCQVLGDVELFFQLLADHKKQPQIVAVTGSNGKSTVVSLLAHIANKLNINAQLAGNIGVPVFDTLASIVNDEVSCLLLELSSFQLETLSAMQATTATILNISDDHLDRHLTLENYQTIKQRIYVNSRHIIFNRDDVLTYPNKVNPCQTLTSFGSGEAASGEFGLIDNEQGLQLSFDKQPLLAVSHLPIAGIHNALNCLAALALGDKLGWDLSAMVRALTSFKGLPHRCEKINAKDKIIWVNDSKATNVGATLAAIEGLAKIKTAAQQLILIAGGDGKGADFSPLQQVFHDKVDLLITLGKDGDKLATLKAEHIVASSLTQAVTIAKQHAKAGDIVLLSPACASLDMFESYAQRGQCFADAIHGNNTDVIQEISYD